MDTTTEATLRRVHVSLINDLGKLGQLIEPINERAPSTISEAFRHLRDLQALIEAKPQQADTPQPSEPPTVENHVRSFCE